MRFGLIPAAMSLILVGAAWGQTAPPLAGNKPARVSLDDLVKAYLAMQLPIPPKNAELAVYESGDVSTINGREVHNRYLAFVLEKRKDVVVVLMGTSKEAIQDGTFKLVTNTADAEETQRSPFNGGPFGNGSDRTDDDDELVVAIQCELTGHHDVAVMLYNRQAQANMDLLEKLALRSWKNEILVPGSDRKALLEKIAALQATQGDGAMLARMAEPVRAPGAVPMDPMEAAVVGMADASMVSSVGANWLRPAEVDKDGIWQSEQGEPDPNYLKVRRDVIKAIPFLLAHLDDRTVSRSYRQGLNNFPPAGLELGDLCQIVLDELTGEKSLFGTPREDLRKAVLAIQTEVAKGDEPYLMAHVLPADPNKPANQILLDTLAAKYPKNLIVLFERSVENKDYSTLSQIEEALIVSSLPEKDRVETLLGATNHPDEQIAIVGIRGLDAMKRPEEAKRLAEWIGKLPNTPKDPYWSCVESAFMYYASISTDEAVWEAYNKWADRADMGLRMEMIIHTDYRGVPDENLLQRIALCRKFLADDTVRRIADDPKMFTGPCAGFGYDVMRVGDLAAMELAYLLDIPGDRSPKRISSTMTVSPGNPNEKPDDGPSVADWNALRGRVKEALAKYDEQKTGAH